MIDFGRFFLSLAVMAAVNYLVRMLPLVLVKKKITNRFVRSFLHYVPYAVLGVMTIPAVFTSTGSTASACAGVVVAVLLARFARGLLTVAACSCGAVLLTEWILRFIG